jgi:hypothetical protein
MFYRDGGRLCVSHGQPRGLQPRTPTYAVDTEGRPPPDGYAAGGDPRLHRIPFRQRPFVYGINTDH